MRILASKMQTGMCFKPSGGFGQLGVPQNSQATLAPWWAGTPPLSGESFGQLKSLAGRPVREPAISDKENGDMAKFSIIQDNKDSGKDQKTQQRCATTLQLPFEHQGRFELGLGQSMACPNYSYVDQSYGLYATTYGAPATHGRLLLPPNMTADVPIYVNAKQYHGIVRRRQARAKAEMENKRIKVRKPYLHESRHRHAMRRARGSGGRFLNTKKAGNAEDGTNCGIKGREKPHVTLIPNSPSSEVLHSYSGNLNSASGGSSISGSEVTSVYSHDDNDHFHFTRHFRPSMYHRVTDMMGGDRATGLLTS